MNKFLSCFKQKIFSIFQPEQEKPESQTMSPVEFPVITNWADKTVVYAGKEITLKDIEQCIIEYGNQHFKSDKEQMIANYLWHSYRYMASLHYVIENNFYEGKIFEAGGFSVFTSMLHKFVGNIDIVHADEDLRSLNSISHSSISNIICMEVIEHINDKNTLHDFVFDGVKKMLSSFWEILEPGGRIFLTTPNACGIFSLQKILLGKSPLLWCRHIREYSIPELLAMCEILGFEVESVHTEYVFTKGDDPTRWFDLLAKQGYSLGNRGDDIFIILRKPRGKNFNNVTDLSQAIIHCNSVW